MDLYLLFYTIPWPKTDIKMEKYYISSHSYQFYKQIKKKNYLTTKPPIVCLPLTLASIFADNKT